jgi:mitochondrial fission protein ELM1
MTKPRICWAVSDGRAGMASQALGLAQALGRLTPLAITPVTLARTGPLAARDGSGPDVWIGCGRAAVRAAPAVRAAHPGALMVYIQDPRAHHGVFDLILPPRHDGLEGDNVLPLIGSPNRVTRELLEAQRIAFADRLAQIRAPRAAVLIGGDSKHHRFSEDACAALLDRIEALRARRIGLLITLSRRTPDRLASLIRERYGQQADIWLHQGDGPNPYFAFLAGADWIFVTEDSTNMLTEAAATGTPVYRLGVDGRPGKFRRLYAALEGHGAVRPFLGALERWTYVPLHETERAARRVLEILDARCDMEAA